MRESLQEHIVIPAFAGMTMWKWHGNGMKLNGARDA
jgi:hypothetical protein